MIHSLCLIMLNVEFAMLTKELDNAKKLSVFHVIANSTKIYIADCSDFCSYGMNGEELESVLIVTKRNCTL